jgi:hypothetical protein
MSRSATVVLAVLVVLGSSGLSASAFARGGYGADGAGTGFRGNNFGAGFGTSGDGHDGYGSRTGGSRDEFRGYGGRNVWGHRGAYYGPMIPMI